MKNKHVPQINTPWRLISTAIYTPPSDGKIYGTFEVDVTDAWDFIRARRKNGEKITMTHLVTAALARALAEDAPEVNCFVRRGKLIQRNSVDVSVTVVIRGGSEMSMVKVRDADKKTLSQISNEIREKAVHSRTGNEEKSMGNKYTLSRIPWPFRRWIFLALRFIAYEMGINLRFMGLSENTFGSIVLSNIGTHGLTTGMPALFPAAKIPAVVVMGKEEDKPVVRDGKIVIRTILPLTATMDHRILDGGMAGKLARGVARRLQKPADLNTLPEE